MRSDDFSECDQLYNVVSLLLLNVVICVDSDRLNLPNNEHVYFSHLLRRYVVCLAHLTPAVDPPPPQ